MDFDQWMRAQNPPPVERDPELYDYVRLRCVSCGKEETRSRLDYENGDTGWYCDSREFETLVGVCGGGPHCLP